jgi:hypothetical protein
MAGSRRLQAALGARTGSFYGVATPPQLRLPVERGSMQNERQVFAERVSSPALTDGLVQGVRGSQTALTNRIEFSCDRSSTGHFGASQRAKKICAAPVVYLRGMHRREALLGPDAIPSQDGTGSTDAPAPMEGRVSTPAWGKSAFAESRVRDQVCPMKGCTGRASTRRSRRRACLRSKGGVLR